MERAGASANGGRASVDGEGEGGGVRSENVLLLPESLTLQPKGKGESGVDLLESGILQRTDIMGQTSLRQAYQLVAVNARRSLKTFSDAN